MIREPIDFAGRPGALRLAQNAIELVVTTDVGPRVLGLSRPRGPNLLHVADAWKGRTAEDGWVDYGGHRLWHAPEAHPRTYAPDNAPVRVEETERGAAFTREREPDTGISKRIEIELHPTLPRARLRHVLRNEGAWPVRLAPWALSVVAPGGVAVVPLPPRGSHEDHLLPNGSVVTWAYTDLADPRWTWGSELVLVRQDPGAATPQKAGFAAPQGWCAYRLGGDLLVKTFRPDRDAAYPDLGSRVEVFTDAAILELETLAPLRELEPGAEAVHVEAWRLFGDVPGIATEADALREVRPRALEALAEAAADEAPAD